MGAILSLCFHPPKNDSTKPHRPNSSNYNYPTKQNHADRPSANLGSTSPLPVGPSPQSYASFPDLIFHPAPDPPLPTSEQKVAPGVKYVINLAYCYKVPDGDTLNVDYKEKDGTRASCRVRIKGVDCPESDMKFGNEARMFTEKFCLRRNVSLHVWEKDQYGRLVCDVVTDRGVNLGFELVKWGWAWWYRPYDKRETFGQLEEVAKNTRKGLWADKNPTPPWVYRKKKKNGGGNSNRNNGNRNNGNRSNGNRNNGNRSNSNGNNRNRSRNNGSNRRR